MMPNMMDPRYLAWLRSRGLGQMQPGMAPPPEPQIDQTAGGFNPEVMRAQMPMPNPKGVGTAYDRAGIGMQNGLGKFSNMLFPIDPQAAQNMSAEQMKGMQSNALMQMGLGMMGNARQGLGPALASGYFNARENQLGDQKTNFVFSQANRGEQREIQQIDQTQRNLDRAYSSGRDDEMWMRDFRDRQLKEMQNYHLGMRQMQAGEPPNDDAIELIARATLVRPELMNNYLSRSGMGNQEARNRVTERQAAIMKENGTSPDRIAAIQASVKAHSQALAQNTKAVSSLQAFETVVRNNGQRLKQLFAKVSDTGVPIGNVLTRGAAYNLGSADVAELRQVLQNFQTETSRIVAGHPLLLGQPTDTARKEIESVVSGNMTVAQANRVIDRLLFESQVREQGFMDSIAKSQQAIIDPFGAGGLGGGLGNPNGAFQTAPGGGFPDGFTVQPGFTIEEE